MELLFIAIDSRESHSRFRWCLDHELFYISQLGILTGFEGTSFKSRLTEVLLERICPVSRINRAVYALVSGPFTTRVEVSSLMGLANVAHAWLMAEIGGKFKRQPTHRFFFCCGPFIQRKSQIGIVFIHFQTMNIQNLAFTSDVLCFVIICLLTEPRTAHSLFSPVSAF